MVQNHVKDDQHDTGSLSWRYTTLKSCCLQEKEARQVQEEDKLYQDEGRGGAIESNTKPNRCGEL